MAVSEQRLIDALRAGEEWAYETMILEYGAVAVALGINLFNRSF